SNIDEISTALQFIELLHEAELNSSDMELEDIELLRNPAESPLQVKDLDIRLALKLYLTTSSASQKVYNMNREAILERHPKDKIPSFDQIKRHVNNLSGIKPIVNDMCIKSCVAF
ncbi:hypothetical protein BDQ17DRAFT_1202881, partial [Cyathus striatus]